MAYLGRVVHLLRFVFEGVARGLERGATSVFGSSNVRYLKKLQRRVGAINTREAKYQEMTDAELREQTDKFRKRLQAGETLEDLLVDAFAVCREAGRRVLGMRHYDVQLMGGMVLHSGAIAEMANGEGKTLVATLPAYLNALEGKGVHVVTVNDYLARRDMEWMGPLYLSLGLSVGAIQSQMPISQRHEAYECDVTYGTNNEFGFDYLRDNMRVGAKGDDRYPRSAQQVQEKLHYAIIDEVDNILIDEARTPLIISGPAHDDVNRYCIADRIVRQLQRDLHFQVNEKEHSAHLTDEGLRRAEELAGVESFCTAVPMEWPHLMDNALRAHYLYRRDVHYVVRNGEVAIVDEFTGRLMPGRNWSDGLHQAVEAKEGVPVKEENQTLATITLQNFFKLYDKIGGMTATAMTEADEFWEIYKLRVVAIPTNAALVEEIERMHKWDVLVVGKDEERWGTIIQQGDDSLEFQPEGTKHCETIPRSVVRQIEPRGRPILVGTVSIERSELISGMLARKGVPHQVLNAKHQQREAEIVAQAGRKGAVTIATNIAGRGTDIILGGNPEAMAWGELQEKYPTRFDVPPDEWDALVNRIEQREHMKAEGREVAALGGLHVIGTERHEARRTDQQLRQACGRQGDPGSSRFYLSLEDDLMRIFAGEWVKNVLSRLGMEEGQAIESRMVSRRIDGAQKKLELRNSEIRKNLLDYDKVLDEQRSRVYGYRQQILDGADCKPLILGMIDEEIRQHIDQFLARDYGIETYAQWAGKRLAVELDPRDFRNLDPEAAETCAKDRAKRLAEGRIPKLIEENLPEDVDPQEWNWEALAMAANTWWQLSMRDRDLKRVGREGVSELLLARATAGIERIDLADGARFLEPDFGPLTACAWVKHKFGVELDLEEIRHLKPEPVKQLVRQRARALYEEKEIEFPVMAGLYHFAIPDSAGHKRYDREGLAAWARERFGADFSVEDLKNKRRDQICTVLVEHSRRDADRARQKMNEGRQRLEDLFHGRRRPEQLLRRIRDNRQLQSFSDWLREECRCDLPPEEMLRLKREELEDRLSTVLDETFRPEMRKMERALVLQLLDTAWKDHLLVMDRLRSTVGLPGYAQDPKVQYGRQGMQAFENMWMSVGQRVTDLIFRMEQLDERFVGSTWT